MLSNTSKYAIRAVIYLALQQEKRPVGIKQIAKVLELPSPFLSKILQTLARKKMLYSCKGPNGGFTLQMDPDQISLLQIAEIIDGNDFFETCLIGLKTCTQTTTEEYCPLHDHYVPIKRELYELFKNQTVGMMARDILKGEGRIKL